MGLTAILLIALGLSMDCFAVSISSGLSMMRFSARKALKIAFFFGGFQALMLLIGFAAGLGIRDLIAAIDHWVAFILLAFIGARMIYGALTEHEEARRADREGIGTLMMLAVATSIDALAVGVSLSLLNIRIILPAFIIGAVTFLVSLLGVAAGRKAGNRLGTAAEILGGVILIGIGLKIIWEHTF